MGLRPPYSPNLAAPSTQLAPTFFGSSISDLPQLEPYSSLAQRDQSSTQAQDALGGFSSGAVDAEGKGGLVSGGLDSLSEYTLPGEFKFWPQIGIVSPRALTAVCLWSFSGGRVCHSFIPGMRNHGSAQAVSTVFVFGPPKLSGNHYSPPPLSRTAQQEQTSQCCPGILWRARTSSVRPATPVTAE